MTAEWRKFRNDELHYLYASPNVIWWGEMGRACGGEEREIQRFIGETRRKDTTWKT
jgi:hypothetical protein